jgi:collagenase-like PrtC family protease
MMFGICYKEEVIPMMIFSIPSDFKEETINRLEELNEEKSGKAKVLETYGQATEIGIQSSGRVTEVLPKITLQNLEHYVKYSKDRGIDFNYTLNPACFGNYEFSLKGMEQLLHFLRTLYNIGINSLTITSPSIFEMISGLGLNFKLKASAICEITSPDKALFYKKLGANRIVLDPDITRNFKAIKNIQKVANEATEIIINNVCYKHCAYKMFHYNHEAHCNSQHEGQHIKDYFTNRCSLQKAGGFMNPIRLNWIRPEDLHYYYDLGIRHFKIQGRQNVVTGDVIKTLRYYMKENFDGNLYDLITLFSPYNAFQPYIDNKSLDGYINRFLKEPCDDLCDKCGYCESFADKSIDKTKALDLNKKATTFFHEFDSYTKVINGKVKRSEERIPFLDLPEDF